MGDCSGYLTKYRYVRCFYAYITEKSHTKKFMYFPDGVRTLHTMYGYTTGDNLS